MRRIGESLKAYREENNYSQLKMAKLLGITQVHVSRIEKDKANVSKRLLAKIISLIGEFGEGFGFELETETDEIWNYSHFTYGNNLSGDRIRINQKSFKTKTILLHCDAAGSDQIATRMADLLVVGFETVLGSNPRETECSPESIYVSLNKMAKHTKDFWRGEPSLTIVCLNKESGKLDLLNAGMPNIYKYNKANKELEKLPEKKWPPLGGLSLKKELPYSERTVIEKGEVVLSFSDGFIDEFELNSSLKLETHLLSVCRAMKGDSEGIGYKLLKTFEKSLKGKPLDDNLSFMIISKV